MADDKVLALLKHVEQILQDELSLIVGDLTISIDGNNVLNITGWSNFIHFESLTKKQSLIELTEIKGLFQLMHIS